MSTKSTLRLTSELVGPALDWAVAKCEGVFEAGGSPSNEPLYLFQLGYTPSTDWSQGGPIIERERIILLPWADDENYNNLEGWWTAGIKIDYDWIVDDKQIGPMPLIAAMRCYVASKLGDEVDIPNELKG